MIENSFAKEIYQKYIIKRIQNKENRTLIIGIDGPTASGKTILADNLKAEIESSGKKCFIYRLDWTLISREDRLKDLAIINKTKASLAYEGALHMRLSMVENFLKEIRETEFLKQKKNIKLKKLYSRENDGKINGTSLVKFDIDHVIILEGHYTCESRIARYIDINLMLLGDCNELINRKKNRVKNYRASNEVEDYFNRIDLPSFKNHLKNFTFASDIIVDNTDYRRPKIKDQEFLLSWINLNKSQINKKIKKAKLTKIIDCLFSNSLQSNIYREIVYKSIIKLLDWDKKICEYLTISIEQINDDLTTYIKRIIDHLNEKNRNKAFFEVIHTNAIHNIYKRKLPVTLGVNISFKETNERIQLLMEVTNSSIFFRLIWDGGYKKIKLNRELGKFEDYENTDFNIVDDTRNFFKEKKIKVYTPSPFLLPSFIKGFDFDLIITDHEEENVSSVSCINDLINNFSIWIRRFATFKELFFFKEILLRLGVDCVEIGNYLIASKLSSSKLKNNFKVFCLEWDRSFQDQKLDEKAAEEYDKICENERKFVKKFVEKNCNDFVYLDEKLYCKRNIQPNNFEKLEKQIKKMLLCKNRLMRKKISQFIIDVFPNLKVNTAEYWDDIKVKDNRLVNYSEILELQPSILSEIYLWLNLRGEDSAVLASNIYDIKETSLDCYAFISSSFKNRTPIVLQASLNAIGQKESYKGKNIQGYLMPKNGVMDFISAATNASRDFFLETGNSTFLYGLGLDHINYENDLPLGRANRFLSKSMNSELVTHYVIDGSKKFKIKNENHKSYIKAYEPVIEYALSLMDNIPSKKHYIFDKEICAGELNYIENNKSAIIPTPENFQIFVDVYRKKVEQKKLYPMIKRPMLFIGNLGTTHHGSDSSSPKVEIAKEWKRKIQRYNFVSAVLHGTTQTHSDYLKRSTGGCHKVNVAGDFLETMINSLPVELYEIILSNKNEKKKSLHLVASKMKKLNINSKKKIIDAMEGHCDAIQKNINSPKLTPNDISYFKYRPYKYSKNQVEEILNVIKERLNKTKIIKISDTKSTCEFSASMIEVPFNNFYKKVAQAIYKLGINNFHIDVGDGQFITRKIDALKKVKFLKKNFPKTTLHCHLMVKNPHKLKENKKSYIEEYIAAGCNKIAVHERSFADENDLFLALNLIKKYNAKPGIIIETYRKIDENLLQLLVKNKIEWVVIMGVVIGYGGQIFDNKIISKIKSLKSYYRSINKNIIIEVDGGLTEDNIKMCIDAGSQILSGWSIVKSPSINGILGKVRRIKKICGK
jgi:ribulose-phosphate 3-epimerase